MKKYILLLLISFLIGGCKKNFNSVVDPSVISGYQVKEVTTADSFTYSSTDSLMVISIALTSSKDVKEVYCDVYSSDGNQLNTNPVELFDNGNIAQNGDTVKGDFNYSNKFPLSSAYSSGDYQIKYYVTSSSDVSKLIAIQYFAYSTGKANVAPVISNLVAPDTVSIGTTDVYITLTVDVKDDNGLSDVQSVYFNSFIPPNGNPASSNPYLMYDNGTNGDQVAGDGTYSITIDLPPSGVTKGTYRWEFFAKDKGGLLSNKITHYIVVQ